MAGFLPRGEVAVRKELPGRSEKSETVAAAREVELVPRAGEKCRVGADDEVVFKNEGKMIFDPRGLQRRTGTEGEDVIRDVIGRPVMLVETAPAAGVDTGAVPNQVARACTSKMTLPMQALPGLTPRV